MRVLLAVDGSGPSDIAARLVGAIAWPEGSTIRVVSVVVPPLGALVTSTSGAYIGPEALAEIEAARVGNARRVLDAAAVGLNRADLVVQTATLQGAAAREIVDDAATFDPDLIVVGSHGHGVLGGLLLGSVSAEVVDHAPAPVLIARRPDVQRVLLALDGSTAAGRALDLVATWPIFRSLPVLVVSISEPAEPTASATPPAVEARLQAARASVQAGLRAHTEALVATAADRLRATGIAATAHVAEGRPADEVVRLADAEEVDLIVIGSRGLNGLTRLRLGSTSRAVLHAASVSVLVVPGHAVSTSAHWR